jgi:ATP-dependent DNA helicase DinG
MSEFLCELFKRDGHLSQVFDSYEPRKGQIELTVAIDAAIHQERHLLGEGPCGTGKGIAYLAPAIHYVHEGDDRRVVVCTETIALQEQLIAKDLPLLVAALPFDFTYTLLKGRTNYLCLRKYHDPKPWDVTGSYVPPRASAVQNWAQATLTGDRSELPFKPRGDLWRGYSSNADDCIGKRCTHHTDCWANQARARAADSDVVVTNMHMLMANIQYAGAVLPPFQVLVCDEAHKLPEVARDCLGFGVSYYGVQRLARWIKRHTEQSGLARRLDTAAERLFEQVADYYRSQRYSQWLSEPNFVDASTVTRLLEEARALAVNRAEGVFLTPPERARAEKVAEQAETIKTRLEAGVEQSGDQNVYWLEEHKKGWVSIEARPVEVGGILHTQLFDAVPSVVLVSATMTTGNNFGFLRRELGVPSGAMEVIGETPFDWMEQSRFIVPAGIPDPPTGYFPTIQEKQQREREWSIAVADCLEEVIAAAEGRTLALFTSRRNMDHAAAQLAAGGLPGALLVQEPGATLQALVKRFREEPHSVLLGVASFWTGLDVPGDTLSVVFIDRLPFPAPTDPVTAAICNRLDRKYGPWSGFAKYMIPRTIMQLRQGVGRLIRCQTDRGVVVLADRRLLTKAYRTQVFNSLPPMPALPNVEAIEGFLRGATSAGEI